MRLGKRGIVRALLETRRLLEKHDTRHYLNRLYVDDYCVWVQRISDNKVLSLLEHMEGVVRDVKKEEVGWGLENLEQVARDEGIDMMMDDYE